METKIELEVVTNQLQSALDELKRKRLDRNLIHDYITEALSRVKKLNKPAVSKCEEFEREALLLASFLDWLESVSENSVDREWIQDYFKHKSKQ